MSRDNETWVGDLRSVSEKRDLALSELRGLLLRNLHKALSSYSRADDSFIDDAVQDSLVRILSRLDQFEGRSQFVTWATTLSIRVAMTELRRHRWRDVSLDEIIGETSQDPQWVSHDTLRPERQVERSAIVEKMQEVIDTQLSEKQRTALIAEMKGMPQDEIARQMGSNRNAIYKLTHDARKKLKRGLESAGYGASDVHAVFAE